MDQKKELTIVCVSDTHNNEIPLPDGDILLHCGDFTLRGEEPEVLQFIEWLKKLKEQFKHIVLIAGNHDSLMDVDDYERLKPQFKIQWTQTQDQTIQQIKQYCTYLVNESVVIEGYKIWGSPYSLEYYFNGFQLSPDNASKLWSQIDQDTDIVMTHGPPYGFRDVVVANNTSVGDKELLKRILEVKPKYHLFGHIHEGYGKYEHEGVTFMNCSTNTHSMNPKNAPFVIKLPIK